MCNFFCSFKIPFFIFERILGEETQIWNFFSAIGEKPLGGLPQCYISLWNRRYGISNKGKVFEMLFLIFVLLSARHIGGFLYQSIFGVRQLNILIFSKYTDS